MSRVSPPALIPLRTTRTPWSQNKEDLQGYRPWYYRRDQRSQRESCSANYLGPVVYRHAAEELHECWDLSSVKRCKASEEGLREVKQEIKIEYSWVCGWVGRYNIVMNNCIVKLLKNGYDHFCWRVMTISMVFFLSESHFLVIRTIFFPQHLLACSRQYFSPHSEHLNKDKYW